VLLTPTPVIRSSGSVSGIATALVGTAELYAWEDSRGGVWYAVRDPSSGAFTVSATQIDALGTSPQIVVAGTLTYIFFAVGSLIWSVTLNTSNPSLGIIARQMIASDGTSGTPFAAVSSAAQTAVLLVYQEAAGSTFHVQLRDASLNLLQNTTCTLRSSGGLAHRCSVLHRWLSSADLGYDRGGRQAGADQHVYRRYVGCADCVHNHGRAQGRAVGLSRATIQINWDDQPASSQPCLNRGRWQRSPLPTTATLGTLAQCRACVVSCPSRWCPVLRPISSRVRR
jgi:hypothetical protein